MIILSVIVPQNQTGILLIQLILANNVSCISGKFKALEKHS